MRNATTVVAAGIGAMFLGIAVLGMATAPVQAVPAPSPSPSSSDTSVSVVIPGPPTPTQIPPTPTQIPPNGNGNGRGPGNGRGNPEGPRATDIELSTLADGSPATPNAPTQGAAELTLDQERIAPNGLMTATAAGYAPGEKVKFVLYSEPIIVGDYVADASGNIRAQFRIPEELPPGRHVAEATGWDSRHVANKEFTVVTAAVAGGIPALWWIAAVLAVLLIAMVSTAIYFRSSFRGWFGARQPVGSTL